MTVHVYGADLGSEDQRVAFVEWLAAQNLKIDFLINNAGLGDQGTFDSSDWKRIKAILEVNISALTHHSPAPPVNDLERSGGHPQCQLGWQAYPLPNIAVYAATKAYVTSLSESLAIELRPKDNRHGIVSRSGRHGFHSVARRPGVATTESHVERRSAFVVTPEEAVRAALVAVSRGARGCPGPPLPLHGPDGHRAFLHYQGGAQGLEEEALNPVDHESAIDKTAGAQNASPVNKLTKLSGVRRESADSPRRSSSSIRISIRLKENSGAGASV